MSKYIGETEKNLDVLFAVVVAAETVLLIDEADAIFGRRSEVREADDRYANMEIDYRRPRIETSKGLVHSCDQAGSDDRAAAVPDPSPRAS